MAKVAVQRGREEHSVQSAKRSRLDAKPVRQRIAGEPIDKQHHAKAQHNKNSPREPADNTVFVRAHLCRAGVGEAVDEAPVSLGRAARFFVA